MSLLFRIQFVESEALGLDYALTAMFIALLILQLQSVASDKLKHHLSLVIYMIIAMLILMTMMPSHIALIVATIIVATIGVVTDLGSKKIIVYVTLFQLFKERRT